MRHHAIEAGKFVLAALVFVFGVALAIRGIHNSDTFGDQLAFGAGALTGLVIFLLLNSKGRA
jgi:hypothetical protein